MRVRDDAKEAAIRREATLMIVEQGFKGFSMEKLAKAVNISPSTIYVYFKSREDLLNRLYADIHLQFEEDALRGFDPEMAFADGLWMQWMNRYKNIQGNPTEFYFHEQFRNSPLIRQKDFEDSRFRKLMNLWVGNAVRRKEIVELPVEVYWAVAYGAFYTLVRFHLDKCSMSGAAFALSGTKLRQTFKIVLKSLQA